MIFPERRSGSKIFDGMAFHCVTAPLHLWVQQHVEQAHSLQYVTNAALMLAIFLQH